MTVFYPNELDIYGFCPIEDKAEIGDWVTDANTGIVAKVRFQGEKKGVYTRGVFYEIREDDKQNERKTVPADAGASAAPQGVRRDVG